MPDIDSAVTAGVEARGYRRGSSVGDSWDQYVIPTSDRIVSYEGRATTFITPGRAAVNQNLMAIHNATGSAVLVAAGRIRVDLLTTVTKALTVVPPIIRIQRFTALPTGGTALTKVPMDTAQTSSSSVTIWGDSSADNAGAGTVSAAALTITATGGITQTFAPRIAGGTGTNPLYEPIDTAEFFFGDVDLILRPLEGVVVSLTGATAAANPNTDKWIATMYWQEYTRP